MADSDGRYSVGLVGLGAIGTGYDAELPIEYVLTHARAASVHPASELAWGIDPDRNRRAEFTRTYDVDTHESIDVIVSDDAPDILVVATPAAGRLQDLSKLLALDTRVMLIEKPLGQSAEESAEVVRMLRESEVSVVINYTRRFSAGSLKAREKISTGELGEFRTGVVRYKDGIRRNCSHLINLLLYVLSGPASVVESGPVTEKDELGDGDAFFRVSIAGGEVIFLPTGVGSYSFADIDLLFENGRVQFEDHAFNAKISVGTRELPTSGFRELNKAVKIDCEYGTRYQYAVLDEIVRRLDSGAGFEAELNDAEATEMICNTILQ